MCAFSFCADAGASAARNSDAGASATRRQNCVSRTSRGVKHEPTLRHLLLSHSE